MAGQHNLSKGCLVTIMRGGEFKNPIVQVLGSKKINASGSGERERHRVQVSDGMYTISYAMITSEFNDANAAKARETNSIIEIEKYITSTLSNTEKANAQKILLILEYKLVAAGSEVGEKIGSPVPLTEAELKSNDNKGNSVTAHKPPNATNGNNSMGNQSLADQIIHPISSLTPYQNRWVIKARVTSKSPIKSWSNSRGDGTLFTFTLVDSSGEIRVTAFRDAVDKFYQHIEVDKVYYVSKCQLKPANKQYSTVKNDYEMTLSMDSIVQECEDDDDAVPQTQYDFVTIDQIAATPTNTMLDIIGVVQSVGDLQCFQAKSTGRDLKKKDVTLVDQSKTAITLALWGNDAESFEAEGNPVVAIKGARVGEFGGGKNLSTVSTSTIKLNPDMPEAFRLRSWYDQEGGGNSEMTNLSARTGAGNFSTPWMSFAAVREQNVSESERGLYFQLMGTILLVKAENIMYKSCPTPECNKKIVDMENGMYKCEKCNREYPNFKYRLLASMNIGDYSGNQWLNMFNNEVEKVLGYTAQELGDQMEQNSEAVMNIANEANFKEMIFKCRTKMEVFNDESRLKTVCIKVDPINYEEYNKHLIEEIEGMVGI